MLICLSRSSVERPPNSLSFSARFMLLRVSIFAFSLAALSACLRANSARSMSSESLRLSPSFLYWPLSTVGFIHKVSGGGQE